MSLIVAWTLKTLPMYRFNEKVIRFMETSMKKWNTTMKLFYNEGCIITDPIKVKRGIFQGDSISPLLFCLALVPSTSGLAVTGYGYKITSTSALVATCPSSNTLFWQKLIQETFFGLRRFKRGFCFLAADHECIMVIYIYAYNI